MATRFLGSIALTAVVALALGVAKAERLPTDVELKAAYCLKVIQRFTIPFAVQARLDMMSARTYDGLDAPSKARIDTAMKDEIKRGRDSEARLKLYLLPRVSHVEPALLLAAMKEGERDAAKFRQSLAKCYAECPLPAPSDSTASAASKCGTDCAERDELAQRVARCSNLDLHPF